MNPKKLFEGVMGILKAPRDTIYILPKNFYSKSSQDILILYADNPFIDSNVISKMINLKKKNNSDIVLLSVVTNKKNELIK